MVYHELPWFQFQATEWRHLPFPLWDPHQWCGQPFLGQVLGAGYPLNWLLPHLPFERGKIRLSVLHWCFVLIHFQGALFAYWLCRDLKRSRAASLLAGLVFTLGGFLSSTDWFQHLDGAVWAPAVFLFLLRALRGERPFSSAALCGVFLGAAWLSGHHEAPIYLTTAVAGVWLFHIARGPVSRRRLLALALGWKDHPPVRFFGLIALLGLLFSMGGENLFHGLLYSVVPLFDKARAPARALVIFNLGVAPLIAFGLDALRDQPRSLWLRRMTWCLAALAVSLVLLTMFELGRASDSRMPDLRDTEQPSLLAGLRANDDVAAFLRWQAKPLRVDVSDQDIPSNFGDWHLIDTLGGYMPGVTANVFRLGAHLPRVQDLLAVNYRVARDPSRANHQLVFKGVSGVNVYRNPAALPRARVVHELVQARSYEELGRLHADEGFDPRKKAAMLTPPPQLERCEGAAEPVTFLTIQPARVVLEATLGCRGMLVLADTAFPGWKAKVDGRQVALHEVSGALRGLVVEAGRHRIEMTYRPASATLGAVMTLSGLLGAWLLRRRERRPNNPTALAVKAQQLTQRRAWR